MPERILPRHRLFWEFQRDFFNDVDSVHVNSGSFWPVRDASRTRLQFRSRCHIDILADDGAFAPINLRDARLPAPQGTRMDDVGVYHQRSRAVIKFNEAEAPILAGVVPLHSVNNRNHRAGLHNAECRLRFAASAQPQHAHPVIAAFIKNAVNPRDIADDIRRDNLRQEAFARGAVVVLRHLKFNIIRLGTRNHQIGCRQRDSDRGLTEDVNAGIRHKARNRMMRYTRHGNINNIKLFLRNERADIRVRCRAVLLGITRRCRLVYITDCDEVIDIFEFRDDWEVRTAAAPPCTD